MQGYPAIPIIPDRASTVAGKVDLLFAALTLVTLLFTLIICVAIAYFAVKYRRGHKVDRSNPPLEHLLLELGWTAIPLVIALGLFVWSTSVYFGMARPPANAMNIYVVGKQWMWKLQHPAGRWEMNELHVPTGRPVKLTMTSEDVIHSFFVPAFRLKADVLPGKYTTLWFEATEPGTYHLYCAEYCGTNHSGMVGSVVVMEPADYERWLRSGTNTRSMAAAGERLFMDSGCSGCHGAGSSVRAPLLDGIYGKPVAIEQPGGRPGESRTNVIVADDRYIHDSIVLPEQEIAAGYDAIMPTFRGRLKEEEILQIIDYIKSLGNATAAGQRGGQAATAAGAARGRNSRTLGAEDYRARTGFVPPNLGTIRGDATRTVTGTVPGSSTPYSGRNTGGATVGGDVTRNVTGGVPSSSTPESARGRANP